MSFLSRRFADPSDIPLLVDWVRGVRPPERATDYPSVADLPELLALPHNQETTRIWFAETGELLGFAFVDVFHTLRFEIDWQWTTPALESAVVAWSSECLAKTPASALLYATSHGADTPVSHSLNEEASDVPRITSCIWNARLPRQSLCLDFQQASTCVRLKESMKQPSL